MPTAKLREIAAPDLYLAQALRSASLRIAQVLHGSVLKRYGLRLVPELYAHLNPMPFEAAAEMEKDLAEDLRRAGYTVTGGH